MNFPMDPAANADYHAKVRWWTKRNQAALWGALCCSLIAGFDQVWARTDLLYAAGFVGTLVCMLGYAEGRGKVHAYRAGFKAGAASQHWFNESSVVDEHGHPIIHTDWWGGGVEWPTPLCWCGSPWAHGEFYGPGWCEWFTEPQREREPATPADTAA